MIDQDDESDTVDDLNDNKHRFNSNFYAILSPPPCQVEGQEPPDRNVTVSKRRVTFKLPPNHPTNNKIALRWTRCLQNRKMAKANWNALTISAKTTYRLSLAQLAAIQGAKSIAHVRPYSHGADELRRGVLDGSIPSAAADSGAISSIGTKHDSRHFIRTGKRSNKTFRMPNGALESALDIGHC